MQTVRWMHQHHDLSININKSSFSLCDTVDKLKGIECGRAGLGQYIPVMSLIKLEKSSKDDYELIMIWWPSKACLAQSPVTLLVESVPSINRSCNSSLKTYNVKIRGYSMLERLSWSAPCGQNYCCYLTCYSEVGKHLLKRFMGKHTGILAVDGVRKQGYISGNRQSALRNTSTEATRGEIVSTALAVAPPHTLRFSFKASVKTFETVHFALAKFTVNAFN